MTVASNGITVTIATSYSTQNTHTHTIVDMVLLCVFVHGKCWTDLGSIRSTLVFLFHLIHLRLLCVSFDLSSSLFPLAYAFFLSLLFLCFFFLTLVTIFHLFIEAFSLKCSWCFGIVWWVCLSSSIHRSKSKWANRQSSESSERVSEFICLSADIRMMHDELKAEKREEIEELHRNRQKPPQPIHGDSVELLNNKLQTFLFFFVHLVVGFGTILKTQSTIHCMNVVTMFVYLFFGLYCAWFRCH